jgi:transcriptional regulator with XRE-family HTH domain
VTVTPTLQLALGQAVKARREELGLTQEQLALRGELQQRWISNVETGKRDLRYTSLRRLAPLLELTPAELMDRAQASEQALQAAAQQDSLEPGPTAS